MRKMAIFSPAWGLLYLHSGEGVHTTLGVFFGRLGGREEGRLCSAISKLCHACIPFVCGVCTFLGAAAYAAPAVSRCYFHTPPACRTYRAASADATSTHARLPPQPGDINSRTAAYLPLPLPSAFAGTGDQGAPFAGKTLLQGGCASEGLRSQGKAALLLPAHDYLRAGSALTSRTRLDYLCRTGSRLRRTRTVSPALWLPLPLLPAWPLPVLTAAANIA